MVAYMAEQGDRIMTVKEIAEEYDLTEFSVARILRSKKVANVTKFSNKKGYRVPEKDWKTFYFRRALITGPEVEDEHTDAQK